MKLISMHVDNFGCLHNYDHSFEEGLNVVLHDNGWGKTTIVAFLKAMLYGFEMKRSKDITENERKRFLPWQGGKYGGYLDFEADGVRYRIYRTFGETPRFDTKKAVNLDTKTTAKIPVDRIGETLFHLDANAFQRSVFINQNGLSIDGAASSIHTRLNNLVSSANDVAAFDGAISSLTDEIKIYEKKGARGQLGDIARQIDMLEQTRERQEKDIALQDAARERISELDILLFSTKKDLAEKSKKLDEVFGEGKKLEASQKLLEDIDSRIMSLQEQIDAIKTDLGGNIPLQDEVDRVKQQERIAASLKTQIEELEISYAKLTKEYNTLLEEYGGSFPTTSQLDRIQSIYGELQGLLSSGDTMVLESEVPEEYTVIKAAVEEDPQYICRLQTDIDSQVTFQKLIRKLDAENRELNNDEEAWREKTKRYQRLKSDVERLQAAVQEQEAHNPTKAEPVITKLEELQKRQQTLDVKRESLSADFLTPEQEAFLLENAGELPDIAEGNEVLKKIRNVEKRQAEVQGFTARLEGEKSKKNSLASSLAQLESVKKSEASGQEEPKKTSGTAFIGIGTALAVVGAILGIAVIPALFALAAVGVILIVLGIISNNSYQNKLQAYNASRAAVEQNEETVRKKEELSGQQDTVQASITSLEAQISELQKDIQADEADVSAWFDRWAAGEEDRSETTVSDILEKAEKIEKLRKKQDETATSRAFITDETSALESARGEIDLLYPEYSGKSVSEALSDLRGKTNAYSLLAGQLQTAIQNEERFVKEATATREHLEMDRSPRADELSGKRDATANELQQLLDTANRDLAVLGLDTDRDHIVQALREAEGMLNIYRQYSDKLNDKAIRQDRQSQQVDELQKRLTDAMIPVSGRYIDREIPERLTLIRQEVGTAARLKAKISDQESDLEQQRNKLMIADRSVNEFKHMYGCFPASEENILSEIYDKVGKYTELIAAVQQLENQRNSVEKDRQNAMQGSTDEEEKMLRGEVTRLTERRDNLLIEYTQKQDFIRQADQSLESYPDTVQEIRALYDQKQKAQNKLATLKRAILLITKAKENLANRYLSKVEDLFNSYMHVWLNNDTVRGILDIDFNITIEEDGNTHVAEGYSTGYCDLIDFCMRLALVDTLFEKEQPFLILDDPFVNLDSKRLEKALELLSVMAADKQIIYFVCHPIRAVVTGENSVSGTEFLQLAEAARKTIGKHQSGASASKKNVRKSPKEMYKVSGSPSDVPFKPAKPDYTITNSIFSMNFVPTGSGTFKSNTYELFFIDAKGHVLNERQMIEVNNGKLSAERIQFSLNTRDDSGDEYELMVRESGQDDYEVAARFPFKAKLAFTGSFGFDF